jgi:archaellum biogenesis ATPase FlaH
VSREIPKPLRSKWKLLTFPDLQLLCREQDAHGQWAEGFLPKRALCLLAGESGLGKTPLAFQLAVSVAAGVPFLGYPTQQTLVVYLDFENGLGQLETMMQQMVLNLGLPGVPENLIIWSMNSPPCNWGTGGCDIWEMISEVKPGLVIVDSLGSCLPEIEKSNTAANQYLQRFREIMSKCKDAGTAIVLLHHLRKPSMTDIVGSLEDETPRKWFQHVRGASALVNGTDIRIGVDEPGKNTRKKRDGQADFALVLRGFSRLRGEIPTMYLGRNQDDDGDPLGYRCLVGVDLLFNSEHEEAFNNLPSKFRFKDAQLTLGKGASATKDLLSKCISAGILRKLGGRAGYEKVISTE